jgi:hypothetical protein
VEAGRSRHQAHGGGRREYGHPHGEVHEGGALPRRRRSPSEQGAGASHVQERPENPLLQFLLIEKEKDNARTSKQKADITRLKTEMVKTGVLKRGAMTQHRDDPYGGIALEPSTRAKRLFFKNNDLRTIDGPFTESKELIGGYAVIELDSFEDAIAMCRDFQKVLGGDLEIDIRVVDQDAD